MRVQPHRGYPEASQDEEILAHEVFLALPKPSVPTMERFVDVVAGEPLRSRKGMDVSVGHHLPPPGGPKIRDELKRLLEQHKDGIAWRELTPYEMHLKYETLHPFMDGNGRSGRVLWAWQMRHKGLDPFALPFLHRWYYQSLDGPRR